MVQLNWLVKNTTPDSAHSDLNVFYQSHIKTK